MQHNIQPLAWKAQLEAFGERNEMRPTRLEVLGPDSNPESDFWIEDGLLFAGIDLDMDGVRGPSVEILLQAPATGTQNHMTHSVARLKRIDIDSAEAWDNGLELEDSEGAVTIMRFEPSLPVDS